MKKSLGIFLFVFSFLISKQAFAISIPDVYFMEDVGDYTIQGNYNSTKILSDFYRNGNPDIYDFILIASNFDPVQKPNYVLMQNHVSGIAMPDLGIPPEWQINSTKLLGVLNMQNISGFVTDTNDPSYYIGWPRVVSHEIVHNWGVFLGVNNSNKYGPISNDGTFHWGRNVLVPSTLMGGNNAQHWRDNGDGYAVSEPKLITDPNTDLRLDPLMMYLAGFSCGDEVKDVKYIVLEPNTEHDMKAKINRYLSVSDIINVEGNRSPDCNHSQKNFRIGMIFLTKKGSQPTTGEIEKINILKERLPEWWGISTDYKSSMSFDGSVLKAPVPKINLNSVVPATPATPIYHISSTNPVYYISSTVPLIDRGREAKQKEEAQLIIESGRNLNVFLKKMNLRKDLAKQKKYFVITEKLLKSNKNASLAQKYSINNFIVYGTGSTKKLSSSRRLKMVEIFQKRNKKIPNTANDWQKLLNQK